MAKQPEKSTCEKIGGFFGGSSDSQSSLDLSGTPQTAIDKAAESGVFGDYNALRDLFSKGPGASDVSAATGASRDLAAQLEQLSKTGFRPSDADFALGNEYAGKAFAPELERLRQSFEDQTTEANRVAASLGRNINDPILQAKLRTGMMRQSGELSARQGAFANDFAFNQPRERLQLSQDRVNLLDQLSQRAIGNRNLLLGLGSSLLGAERTFRSAQGIQWTKGDQSPGIGNVILGIAGSAASTVGKFGLSQVQPGSGGGGGTGGGAGGGGYGGGGYSAPIAASAGSYSGHSAPYYLQPNNYAMQPYTAPPSNQPFRVPTFSFSPYTGR